MSARSPLSQPQQIWLQPMNQQTMNHHRSRQRRFARQTTALVCIALIASMTFASTNIVAQDEQPSAVTPDEGFTSIFDGETLENWEGKEAFWSVQDGCITGKTTAENPTNGNTFLIYRGAELENFELRLEFRIVGGNSGIQYRSRELDDFVVSGYQADIDSGTRFIGILYEERGRGILANRAQSVTIAEDGEKTVGDEQTCDEEEFLKSINAEDWNEYRIIARGAHLEQYINGFKTIDVTDNATEASSDSGILALQLHAGPPMLIQFRDIKIKHFE